MNFPIKISLTVTNRCNLKCQMCGQWSEHGYMHSKKAAHDELSLEQWQSVIDQVADHDIGTVLIRGGEAFLYPEIMPLIRYIHNKNMFISIDSNGTCLKPFIKELVELGNIHITFSIDGPEEVHDTVRGVKGSFQKTKDNIARVIEEEKIQGKTISKSITFTISNHNYRHLGVIPDVARSLGIGQTCIVPYFYVPDFVGKQYEQELKTEMNCKAFTWQGFHHNESGVDFDIFWEQLQQYKSRLGDVEDYPYFPMTQEQYATWFKDAVTPIEATNCPNIENLIDIQPNGDVNFCVDFPDYSFGNVKDATIEALWNSEEAEKFRVRRRKGPWAICHRCGAKHMGDQNLEEQ